MFCHFFLHHVRTAEKGQIVYLIGSSRRGMNCALYMVITIKTINIIVNVLTVYYDCSKVPVASTHLESSLNPL